MKSKFFVFNLIFFIFYSYFSVYSEAVADFRKAFVLNPNGLVLFKSKTKNKEHAGTIEYGDEVLLSLKENESSWIRIKKGSLQGFIPSRGGLKSDFAIFTTLTKSKYALIKKEKTLLYEKPLTDSKSILEFAQFEISEVLAEVYNESESDKKWLYVKTENNLLGYLEGDVTFYDSSVQAETAKKKKQIPISGYFLVSDPIYFKDPGLKNAEDFITKGASKKGEFLHLIESQELNGVIYYKTNMPNPSRHYKMQADPATYNDSPFEAWISEKNGVYYSNSEFTRYTIENSKYKADKSLLEKVAEINSDMPLNFTSILINPLGNGKAKKNLEYFILKLFKGYENSSGYGYLKRVSFIIQKKNDNYEVFSGNIEDRGTIEMFDLDGIPEFYTHTDNNSMSRVAFATPLFYGFVDGAYKQIPLPGNFLDNYTIKNNILYVDARDESNSKRVKVKYKYKKGQFTKVK